jgi:hypothetical protein
LIINILLFTLIALGISTAIDDGCNTNCDKKISKARAIVYRVRVSGLKGYAHATCWEAIASDTRVIRES